MNPNVNIWYTGHLIWDPCKRVIRPQRDFNPLVENHIDSRAPSQAANPGHWLICPELRIQRNMENLHPNHMGRCPCPVRWKHIDKAHSSGFPGKLVDKDEAWQGVGEAHTGDVL